MAQRCRDRQAKKARGIAFIIPHSLLPRSQSISCFSLAVALPALVQGKAPEAKQERHHWQGKADQERGYHCSLHSR